MPMLARSDQPSSSPLAAISATPALKSVLDDLLFDCRNSYGRWAQDTMIMLISMLLALVIGWPDLSLFFLLLFAPEFLG